MATNQVSAQARSFRFSFDDHAVITQAMAFGPPEAIAKISNHCN
ncbi:hypothetical protein [Nostoc sp. C110]